MTSLTSAAALKGRRILIIGAMSAMAVAAARRWAVERGDRFYLGARNADRLADLAADLRVRGASAADFAALDVNELERLGEWLEAAVRQLGGLDIVLIAHGTLGDQAKCEADFRVTLQELNTNMTSVIILLTLIAPVLEQQSHGTIVVISSVAGDRGRQSNYVYGTAKGAVTTFLQGLRQRLHKSGVRVVTVKPGFVDTPMTAEFKKGFLWASPDDVARVIQRAVKSGKDVVYAPSFWRFIMFLICAVPERLFKKLRL
jgi:short-subunit dehydrogenase